MSELIKSRKARLAAVMAASAISAGALAGPVAGTAAAQPVVTGGLVNITVTDVLNNNQVNVQVPIGVAANVCGVSANVLAQGNTAGPVDCTGSTTQQLPVAFRP